MSCSLGCLKVSWRDRLLWPAMIYLCMYVVFDISKRSLSVYVASLLGPHLQTVIFPRAESLDMQELNMVVSGLVLRQTKGELGPELLKFTKRLVETHHIQLKPSEQQVHDVLFFVARWVSVFVCGKKSMLLLTWTMKYKVITSRLDKAPKEIADSTATGAKASQASEDLASKADRGDCSRLQQCKWERMRETLFRGWSI